MASKNSIKMSYKGLTRLITSDNKFQYDELIETVVEKFNINDKYKLAIEFYDEHGNKYNKDTFEYLLLLFPNPQKIFFIRMDASKIIISNETEQTANSSVLLIDDRVPFGKSKLNNRQTNAKEPEVYCEAVPVRRQNCFLGELPNTQQQRDSTSSTTSGRNSSQQIALEIVKRMRLLKHSPPKKKHLNNSNNFKRSLRI
ncbi:companion of reaper [Cochliomyia hominivorax]